MATRLYQNNARVHFNNHIEKDGRFGKRIIYGGYIISLARAISCNGLANTLRLLPYTLENIHLQHSPEIPSVWSKNYKKRKLTNNLGTMMIRTLVSKNNSEMVFPDKKNLKENIVLDIEYSVLIP